MFLDLHHKINTLHLQKVDATKHDDSRLQFIAVEKFLSDIQGTWQLKNPEIGHHLPTTYGPMVFFVFPTIVTMKLSPNTNITTWVYIYII